MNKKHLIKSVFVIVITIFISYLFISPILSTQDDVFTEYMLCKGFGAANLRGTYFEYGFLFYEKAFAFLYQHFPSINWLTAFYILLHSVSGIAVVYLLLERKGYFINAFFIGVYLFLFFIPFITNLSYTVVAAHCIIACFFIFIVNIIKKQPISFGKLWFVFLLMIIALGLRIHIVLPLAAIIVPFLLLVKRNVFWGKWMIGFLGAAMVTVCSFLLHESDYENHIQNWQSIKGVGNAEIELGNYGFDEQRINLEKDIFKRAAFNVIKEGYLYDDTLLHEKLLHEMKTVAAAPVIGNKAELYWLFTDVKQFLILLFIGIWLVSFYTKDKKIKVVILLSNVAAVIVSAYLLLYMRLPERIWLPIFLLLFLITYYPLQELQMDKVNNRTKLLCGIAAIGIFFIQGIRIATIKKENKEGIDNFICANKILNSHPDDLFVEYNESYPANSFPALALPSKYPFNNILFPFFINTELRDNTLKKFKIKDVSSALCSSKNILLIGKPDEALEDYIFQTEHKHLVFAKVSPKGSCLELYNVGVCK